MNFKVVDLSRITPEGLRFDPQPISKWPTIEIDIRKCKETACIASWRWDIESIDELSDRLSECAWDALHLGFSFLLCDIISLPQADPDISSRVIEFSRLYSSLHAVIAYPVDDDIKRPWIRNEALKVLMSPTRLAYVYHKWQLRTPLRFSLVINQICVSRLGIQEIDTSKLPMCDTDEGANMTLSDLGLFGRTPQSLQHIAISLDRRRQRFASDVLLVYEINVASPNLGVVDRLRQLRSNSVVIPALCSIWAMINGLSLSVRGCDWDITDVMEWKKRILRSVCGKWPALVELKVADGDERISISGAIEALCQPQVEAPPRGLQGPQNLWVRSMGEPARLLNSITVAEFLLECISYAAQAIVDKQVLEPKELDESCPQYELGFDVYSGPCSERRLPWEK